MLMLAEGSPLPPPDAAQLYSWLQVAFMILAAAALARTFRRPPPVSAEIDAKISEALRPFDHRMQTLENNFAALRTQIAADLGNIHRAGEERASKIHRRIDAISDNGATMEGELRQVAKNVDELLRLALTRGKS